MGKHALRPGRRRRHGDSFPVHRLRAARLVPGQRWPLTPLENRFRDLAGQTTYGEGFVTHYLGPIIYPEGLTRGTQFLIMGILITVNLIGYTLVWRRFRSSRRTPPTPPA